MTADERTRLLVDFYRSTQSLEDAYAAFERGNLMVADCHLMSAIAVAERLRGVLIPHIENAVSRETSPPRRRIGGEP